MRRVVVAVMVLASAHVAWSGGYEFPADDTICDHPSPPPRRSLRRPTVIAPQPGTTLPSDPTIFVVAEQKPSLAIEADGAAATYTAFDIGRDPRAGRVWAVRVHASRGPLVVRSPDGGQAGFAIDPKRPSYAHEARSSSWVDGEGHDVIALLASDVDAVRIRCDRAALADPARAARTVLPFEHAFPYIAELPLEARAGELRWVADLRLASGVRELRCELTLYSTDGAITVLDRTLAR